MVFAPGCKKNSPFTAIYPVFAATFAFFTATHPVFITTCPVFSTTYRCFTATQPCFFDLFFIQEILRLTLHASKYFSCPQIAACLQDYFFLPIAIYRMIFRAGIGLALWVYRDETKAESERTGIRGRGGSDQAIHRGEAGGRGHHSRLDSQRRA